MRLDHPSQAARSRLIPSALLLLVALGLSACADMSGIQPRATLRDAASLGLPTEASPSLTVDAQWWREFDDGQLNRLMDEALVTSPSLKIVQARLARAQAGAELTHAATGPQLNATLDATRQQYTANGAVPPPLAGTVRESATAQLSGS